MSSLKLCIKALLCVMVIHAVGQPQLQMPSQPAASPVMNLLDNPQQQQQQRHAPCQSSSTLPPSKGLAAHDDARELLLQYLRATGRGSIDWQANALFASGGEAPLFASAPGDLRVEDTGTSHGYNQEASSVAPAREPGDSNAIIHAAAAEAAVHAMDESSEPVADERCLLNDADKGPVSTEAAGALPGSSPDASAPDVTVTSSVLTNASGPSLPSLMVSLEQPSAASQQQATHYTDNQASSLAQAVPGLSGLSEHEVKQLLNLMTRIQAAEPSMNPKAAIARSGKTVTSAEGLLAEDARGAAVTHQMHGYADSRQPQVCFLQPFLLFGCHGPVQTL